MNQWQSDFKRWSSDLREGEWYWGAMVRQVAGSYEEWQTLMDEPLPQVGKWARAQARQIE
ncbi:hypothetical protein [Salinibacter ruber]|uniref:hypothetical protein n=1 Tax=Salinibacter ruber TaxID=146919 RepID=UPI0020740613|nr:hypothetical protein [Salinibacter ruber]MCS4172062.1 hypothetical protein [Salinibacter ruber]